MINKLKTFYNVYPITFILLIALIPRIIAAIFSKGYGMHDDHFLIIEASQSWVDGYDYNAWLPWTPGNNGPSGHSLFYVGLHFVFFKILDFMGFQNPQFNMFLVRLIHALFSLSVVYYGYRIADKMGGKIIAFHVSLILGLAWFIPMLSVRNLVEVVCVPFLIYAVYILYLNEKNDNWWIYLIAGLISGVAFSIRFQTLFFLAGMGLSLMFTGKFKGSIIFGLGIIVSIVIIQSVPDYFLWKKPFAEFTEYVSYNMENATTYFNKPWYMYLILFSGILIPPLSLFVLFGFFRSYKNNLIVFLPALIFLLFHSYFPNKQERFIYPAIPFIIILGYFGWYTFKENSTFWKRNSKLYACLISFVLILNFIALPVVSTAYSKKSRVEVMDFLRKRGDVKGIVINDSNHENFTLTPRYYLDKWDFPEHGITSTNTPEMLRNYFNRDTNSVFPNYMIFYESENIYTRIVETKKYFPHLTYITTIEPGFLDNLLHKLNRHNKNVVCYVYKLNRK
jgi:hypothetical protein